MADSAKLAPLEQKTERTRAKKIVNRGSNPEGTLGIGLRPELNPVDQGTVFGAWFVLFDLRSIYPKKSLLPAWDAIYKDQNFQRRISSIF